MSACALMPSNLAANLSAIVPEHHDSSAEQTPVSVPFTKEPATFAAKPASKVVKARPIKLSKTPSHEARKQFSQ
jgi:hypothetical protein